MKPTHVAQPAPMAQSDPQAPPLAKSDRAGAAIPLSEHLEEVAAYARGLWRALYPGVHGLVGRREAAMLGKAVSLAGLTHDLGKAAVGFQRQLAHPGWKWEFRHEVLSAALLLAGIREPDEALRLAVAAVLTHHRPIDDAQLRNDCARPALPDPEVVGLARSKFAQRMQEMTPYWGWVSGFIRSHRALRALRLPADPQAVGPPDEFFDQLVSLSEEIRVTEPKGLLVALTRGWLMAANHASSAGVRRVPVSLTPRGLPAPRRFQQVLGQHEGDALLEAPTGSGKTAAALWWIRRNRRRGERVFYLLPYQASIEAMADTLQRLFGKRRVATLHARALDYAFQHYFEETGEYETASAMAREERELARLVHQPLKVATPFQLLKWLFGVPRFEIGIAEMVGGLFVFDEIHAYDAHTVALIVEMVAALKQLGGRFLFMSATFPGFLQEILREPLVTASPRGRTVIPLFSLESQPLDAWAGQFLRSARHRLRWHDGTLEGLAPKVLEAAEAGHRVLVVANRVAQAQELYANIRGALGEGVHLLHSRFTRGDRAEKERRILASLRGASSMGRSAGAARDRGAEPVRVLVSTQVVEVSLDISFDRIFTEVAPVDDLLQRFGRVNRYGEHPEGVEVDVARQYDPERLRWVYDLDRVEGTLREAPGDGQRLTTQTASEWVRRVYREGWTAKEQQKFDQARAAFRHVLEQLRPLRTHLTGEEEFHDLFRSIEVLPEDLQEKYLRCQAEKQYLLGARLLVPLNVSTFHALRTKGLVSFLKNGPPVVSVAYDEERGLQTSNAYEGAVWIA